MDVTTGCDPGCESTSCQQMQEVPLGVDPRPGHVSRAMPAIQQYGCESGAFRAEYVLRFVADKPGLGWTNLQFLAHLLVAKM